MISEEKLMQNLLRDYFICKLYVNTCISTRTISSQTNLSAATIKRALTLVRTRKEMCLNLLPKAFEMAIDDGISLPIEIIDDETLSSLDSELEMTTYMLQKNNKWRITSINPREYYFEILKEINSKYFSKPNSLEMTIEEVKKLKDSGKSYKEIADTLGITKTTAYNYYKKSTESTSDVVNNEKSNARGR